MSRGGSFYDSPEWKRARAKCLARQPICCAPGCAERSRRVDHIQTIRSGGDALAQENLQALCERCHNIKTARLDGAFGNAPKTGPAWGGSDSTGRPLDPKHPWNRRG